MLFVFIFILGLLCWLFSTVAAGGAATIVLPILGFVAGVEVAVPAVALAALMANPSRAWLFRRYIDWSVARWLIPGSLLGALFGAYSFSLLPPQWLQILLGLFLISTLFQLRFGQSQRRFTIKAPAFLPVGFLVAFSSGIVGGSGPVLNPFFLNYGTLKEALVATKAINSFVMQAAKLVVYGSLGVMTYNVTQFGLALGAGALVGTYLGKRHLLNIQDARFKLYTLIIMQAAGIGLLYKGITGLL